MERADIAIIGTGPGGVSAALTAKVRNKNILLIGKKQMSDKVSKAHQIMNYPGLPAVTGADMAKAFEKQLAMMEINITDSRIGTVYAMGDYFAIQAGGEVLEAKSVILACGVVSGKTLPGEEEMLGRGVSYCATCDGMLYRGKPVAVLGYTPTARHEAEFLEGIGCSVTYFDRPASCTIRGGSQGEEITCDGKTAAVAGVFILRPTMAPTELFPGLAVENGYVTVDRRMATNLPGVFAAGDCTGGPLQVSKATGEGLVAGQSAAAYAAAIIRKEQAAKSSI